MRRVHRSTPRGNDHRNDDRYYNHCLAFHMFAPVLYQFGVIYPNILHNICEFIKGLDTTTL